MSFQPNPGRETAIEKLCQFLKTVPDDGTVSYVEIEQGSGVKMDDDGKRWLRDAINKRLGREYIAIPGSGIRLDGPETALERMRAADTKIFRSVTRAKKADARITNHHESKLSSQDRLEMDIRRGLRNVIHQPIKQLKRTEGTQTPPMLPKI